MLRFRHARCASQGARSYQEDAAAVWPGGDVILAAAAEPPADLGLVAALADGMGGHAGGALASQTVCAAFLDAFARGEGALAARLRSALDIANGAIADKVRDEPSMSGMGATLIAAAFGVAGLEWVSVGDSPLYLVRRGEMARLNEDHSLAPMLDRLVAEGRLSAERAKADPRRHYLRAAVSGERLDLVDVSQRPLALQPADVVVLASDGIHTLGDEEIARLVTAYLADGPDAIARALIRAVDRNGDAFQDNTTAIVVLAEEEGVD